jgi:hypothetical protein
MIIRADILQIKSVWGINRVEKLEFLRDRASTGIIEVGKIVNCPVGG